MCALLAGGAVKCWGLNEYGQLGTGDTTNRLTPTAVGAGRPARSVQILMLQLNERNLAVMLRIIGLMLISFINDVKINFLLKNKTRVIYISSIRLLYWTAFLQALCMNAHLSVLLTRIATLVMMSRPEIGDLATDCVPIGIACVPPIALQMYGLQFAT